VAPWPRKHTIDVVQVVANQEFGRYAVCGDVLRILITPSEARCKFADQRAVAVTLRLSIATSALVYSTLIYHQVATDKGLQLRYLS
jgi:hypothetical protein